MILRILPAGRLGAAEPIVLAAHQVVVCRDDGTIIGFAQDEGPGSCVRLSHPGDNDFEAALRAARLPAPKVKTVRP